MDSWTHIKLEGCFDWPTEKKEIDFEGHKLVLLPATNKNSASIHINTFGVGIPKARTIINRFLSIICWCSGVPIQAENRGTGSIKPVPLPARETRTIPSSIAFPFNRTVPQNPKAQRALALYREAKSVNSIPYEFLGYYKIINILHKDGSPEQKNYIRKCLPEIKDTFTQKQIKELGADGGDVVDHLYKACRCAIAHAEKETDIDPDDADQTWDLSGALLIIREIAEMTIEKKFGVSRTILSD
jgi:hypothetical protein